MIDSFFETGLWSTSDHSDNSDCPDMLDRKYCVAEISDELRDEADKFIDEFMAKAEHLFTQAELNHSPIGHDLWLTVEGHGAGFWDGDYEKGDEITEIVSNLRPYDSYWSEKLNDDLYEGE